ncbi:hypothetical protein HHK36_017929 [Tetracentron sinense]|uniref:cysteine dioxygenase n=1 Tax=Tetracentron sinense TaxID=13715 RepID=A0A834YV34_TETSI|nr:hypothetical protein HHK36_017929 [Tetracentron sinense]
MKIEASLVEKKRDTDIVKKKTCRKTKRPPVLRMPMALQKLFVACQDVFKGPGTVPPPRDVQKLSHILDSMQPGDVGLSRNLPFFKPKNVVQGTPRVNYTTIYQCENFSLCIFFLPPTAVLPLHNHPEMTVFSKLLLGSMHIKAYDWVGPVKSDDSMLSSQWKLARLKADRVFTAPCNTSVLYPTSGGNIHAFTAITPCAFLDVIGPPYSKADGRDCTYYRDLPYSAFSDGASRMGKEDDCYGWLEEIEMPKDLKMDGVEYWGPPIIETRRAFR